MGAGAQEYTLSYNNNNFGACSHAVLNGLLWQNGFVYEITKDLCSLCAAASAEITQISGVCVCVLMCVCDIAGVKSCERTAISPLVCSGAEK